MRFEYGRVYSIDIVLSCIRTSTDESTRTHTIAATKPIPPDLPPRNIKMDVCLAYTLTRSDATEEGGDNHSGLYMTVV